MAVFKATASSANIFSGPKAPDDMMDRTHR